MALKDVGVRLVAENEAGFKASMQSADTAVSGLTGNIQKHAQQIRMAGLAITAVGGAIIGLSALSVKAASDVEEMTAKFEVVFGQFAEETKQWAAEAAKAMGRSRFEFMEMAASVQDTFVPMGFARQEAAKMSKELTALAVDVASFNNKLDKDVMRDFQSALVGNTETVRKYGIVITEERVKQEAINQGWVENKNQITEAMKVQARMNLILQGTTDAQGDAIRTAGSFANQMKALKAAIQEIQVTMGQALLPIITSLVSKIGSIATKMAEWAKEHPGLTKVIVLITAAVGALAAVIGPLLIMLPSIAAAMPILGAAFAALTGPVGLVIAAIAGLAAITVLVIKNWDWIKAAASVIWGAIYNKIKGVLDSISEKFKVVFGGIKTIFFFIKDAIFSIWDAIKDRVLGVLNTIKDAVMKIINYAKDLLAAFGVKVKASMADAATETDALGDANNKAADSVDKHARAVAELEAWYAKMADTATSGINSVVAATQKLLDPIRESARYGGGGPAPTFYDPGGTSYQWPFGYTTAAERKALGIVPGHHYGASYDRFRDETGKLMSKAEALIMMSKSQEVKVTVSAPEGWIASKSQSGMTREVSSVDAYEGRDYGGS